MAKRMLTRKRSRTKVKRRRVVVSVTIPPAVATEIAVRAEKLGVSRSEYVGKALEGLFARTRRFADLSSDPVIQKNMQTFLENPAVMRAMVAAVKHNFTDKQMKLFEELIEESEP